MGSTYWGENNPRKSRPLSTVKIVAALMAMFIALGMMSFAAAAAPKKADAYDPIQWLACRFGEDSFPRAVYQVTQTSDLQFQLFSKSYAGSSSDDVRGGLNAILDYVDTGGDAKSPYSFETVNTRIVGQNFAGTLPVNDNSYKRWNQGSKVNPYDRFGVAGLKFSNYLGEWKHLFIDACATDDSPTAKYDTGASAGTVRVAQWNVCSATGYCHIPSGINPKTGRKFTVSDIWENFNHRAVMARDREMATVEPDVLLAEEVKDEGDATRKEFYDVWCEGYAHTDPVPGTQGICYNPEKFTQVPTASYPDAHGGQGFRHIASLGGDGGFEWVVLQDSEGHRSVYVAVHLTYDGGASLRDRQSQYVIDLINEKFAGSLYPIVIGGDWNSHDPASCDNLAAMSANNEDAERNMCEAGYKTTNMLTTQPVDLQKDSFQGSSPWKSINGPHFDHIWVNSYVGVGESLVFAPPGPASSDHAMVAADLNLNGTASTGTPGDPEDPETNKYYDTRLEPRSTWEDIPTSQDVRTLQFSKGFGARFTAAISVNFANMIFYLTKLIVVLTIAFLGLAFSDVSSLFGITTLVAGKDGNDGLFNQLHDSVFIPLIVLAILGTAIHLFWVAIVRRQIRQGLGDTLKALACFFAAVIVAVSPAWFIALPNNVAIVGEALVAEQLNSSLVGGNGLCSSNLGASTTLLDGAGFLEPTSTADAPSILKQASINMQSSAGCMLWYNLLLRPWTEGQFGVNYDQLYGTLNGNCVSNAQPGRGSASQDYDPPNRHVCLGYELKDGHNLNARWVGDPIVPLGGGACANNAYGKCKAKIESNWALFQLSTQTNAHAPLVQPQDRGVSSKYSQGVANDWWRVVDAVSNYDEGDQADVICKQVGDCNGQLSGVKTESYPHVINTTPTVEWDTWVGNNQGQRLAAVFTSVLVAALAVLGPLIFAGLSAIYAIGIAILMAFAPIFFLLGCWAGRGWEIFKAWGDLVINTTMKRIALGVLTIISLVFTATVLQQMQTIGYWKSMVLLVILSLALVKARHKILNAVAFARFSSRDLAATSSRINAKLRSAGGAAGSLATATAVGGVTSARMGGGFRGGAMAGFSGQIETQSYQNRFLRNILDTRMLLKDDMQSLIDNGEICVVCGALFQEGDTVSRLNGPDLFGYAHAGCVWGRDNMESVELGIIGPVRNQRSELSTVRSARLIGEVSSSAPLDQRFRALTQLLQLVNGEVQRHQIAADVHRARSLQDPALPKEIEPFVDRAALHLAWTEGEYEYVKLAYTAGWIAWARTQGMEESLEDPEVRQTLLAQVQQSTAE